MKENEGKQWKRWSIQDGSSILTCFLLSSCSSPQHPTLSVSQWPGAAYLSYHSTPHSSVTNTLPDLLHHVAGHFILPHHFHLLRERCINVVAGTTHNLHTRFPGQAWQTGRLETNACQ